MPTSKSLALSQIAPLIIQSEIRAMSVECERCGGINMAQGICDTELPAQVAQGAIEAIHEGRNSYTRLDGVAPLRAAIAEKLARKNGIHADAEKQILVTNGATGALYASALALLNPGDEVILFEPFYGYHWSTMLALRVKPVAVPLAAPEWVLDLDRLRTAITAKTRAIIINTPLNPSGKVFTRSELESVAALAIEHDLMVFTDEIYENFLFDGVEHISMATLPGMAERTITISGFSKTFSITGWRVGYLVAPEPLVPAIGYFHDLTYICAPSVLQYGALKGMLELPDSFYDALKSDYQKKRDQTCAALAAAGFHPTVPQGAYYILAEAAKLPGKTASERARALLAATGVASVPGSAFFVEGGETLLRFCFGKRQSELERACQALSRYA